MFTGAVEPADVIGVVLHSTILQNQNKNGIDVVTSYKINYSEASAFIFVFHLMPQFFVSNSSSRSIPKFSILVKTEMISSN
jgi:hypothetical protein